MTVRISVFVLDLLILGSITGCGTDGESSNPVSPSGDTKARDDHAAVPFMGSFSGSAIPQENPAEIHTLVSGTATHLGRYTNLVVSDATTFLPTGDFDENGLPIFQVSQTSTHVAASGAELYSTSYSIGPVDPVTGIFATFTSAFTVTGGTDRFANATGTLTSEGYMTYVEGDDNDLFDGTFAGTIQYSGR